MDYNDEIKELRCLLGHDLREKRKMEEIERSSRANLSHFFYDLAKTSFTAMVAGAAVTLFTDTANKYCWILLVIGIFATAIFAYIGFIISKKK